MLKCQEVGDVSSTLHYGNIWTHHKDAFKNTAVKFNLLTFNDAIIKLSKKITILGSV